MRMFLSERTHVSTLSTVWHLTYILTLYSNMHHANSKMHILYLYKSSQVTAVDQYVNNKNIGSKFLSAGKIVWRIASEKKTLKVKYYKFSVEKIL
jgi:hypothetical protein